MPAPFRAKSPRGLAYGPFWSRIGRLSKPSGRTGQAAKGAACAEMTHDAAATVGYEAAGESRWRRQRGGRAASW
jgi:hypothetical protein